MHDFFRSKGFLIILIIVAVLSIFIAATYRDRAKVSFIEDTLNSVVKPVQSFSVKASNSIIHFFERVFSSTDLDKENEQLRVKLAQYEIIESELETLREAPSFCTQVRLVDRAAALEQVVKLVSSGALRPRKKVPGLRPA